MSETEVEALRAKGIYALEQRPSPDAPFVVLAHGLNVDHAEDRMEQLGGVYDLLVVELAKRGLATLRFDFRAHGRSDSVEAFSINTEVDDMHNVVAYVEAESCLGGMVGSSFGACATAIVANALPDAPAGVVFLNPPVDVYATLFEPGTQWSRKTLGPSSVGELDTGGTRLLNETFEVGKPFLDSVREWDVAAQMRKITQPVLFIHGSEDTYVPWKETRAIAEEMSNASFITLECEHGFDGECDRTFVVEASAAFLRCAIR